MPGVTLGRQPAVRRIETPEGDADVGRLQFTGESIKSVRDILADTSGGAERTERAQCVAWLKEVLARGPQRTKDIEREAENVEGFSKRTLERARRQLSWRPQGRPARALGRVSA